jgi:acetyl esterase
MPASIRNHEIDIEDVEYLRHGDKPLLARIFQPRGAGPFSLIIDLHGGAWNLGDRMMDTPINEPLAKSGVVVAALDFRMPPEAVYPASMIDINYAIRWFKSQAARFHIRPDLVGLIGSSSGGHQAMLAAMRPRDSRYSSLALPAGTPVADATVRCAILCWPVIDPLARYRFAQKLKAAGAPYPEFVDLVLPLHDKYWKNEDAMAEGNPALALERGEPLATPPVLYLQGSADIVHPRVDLDRFVAGYRKAGGHVQLELSEGASEGFIVRRPTAPASVQAIAKIIEFVHAQMQ